ncbi:hypothetical protein ES706_00889 [subsurface metagenome]
MKKKIMTTAITALMLISLISAFQVTPVSANGSVVPDRETAITAAADRLVTLQSSADYGWDWIVTELETHSENASAYNMYGVVILGLLDAYEETGTASYLDAATAMADHMTSGTASNGDFYKQGGQQEPAGAYDYQFLMRYAEVSENSDYSAYAIALWAWDKANTDIYASPENLNDALLIWGYGSADPGAASWMLAAYGTAIHAMGDDTFATGCADLIVADLDPETGEEYLVGDHMALAECLEFLSQLDSATYNSTIERIIIDLVTAQKAYGCWDNGFAGTFQDTVYAVRALAVYGGTDGQNAARKGAAWLVANQLDTGGWIDDSGGSSEEYSEQDAEGLRALVATEAPVTIGEEGYYSIQSAIDAAEPGNTIEVAAGTYEESVTVDVEDLTLIGVGGPGSTVLDANGYDFGFSVQAAGVTIDNFAVANADIGIEVYDVYIGYDSITIRNNVIENTDSGGIIFRGNISDSTITIENNLIQSCYGEDIDGIDFWNLVDFIEHSRIVIENNRIINNSGMYAVDLDVYEGISSSEIVIVGNTIDNNGYTGIYWGPIQDSHVLMENNSISNNYDGIYFCSRIWAYSEVRIIGNEIDNNYDGIYFEESDIYYSTLLIESNSISNNGDEGIYFDCYMDGNSEVGIAGNTFENNGKQLIDESGELDITEILANNTFDRAVIIDSHVIYSSIQDAINDAEPNDTVLVAAGTYSEWQDVSVFGTGKSTGIMIDKSLTVVSVDGAEATIIDAQEADMGVLINGEGTIATFDGFTVENYDTAGILAGAFGYWGEDPVEVHILNNIVKPPTTEPPNNNCIQVGDGTTGTVIGNEVSGATLESPDWTGSGILVAGSSNVLVSNNYAHDCESGIVIVGYAEYRDAPAENNLIENNLVENSGCGIAIQMNSIDTIIRYNDVSSNDVGVESVGNISWEPTIPSGTEIHYNNIVGNENGVVSSVWDENLGGAEQVDATYNWWGTIDLSNIIENIRS